MTVYNSLGLPMEPFSVVLRKCAELLGRVITCSLIMIVRHLTLAVLPRMLTLTETVTATPFCDRGSEGMLVWP